MLTAARHGFGHPRRILASGPNARSQRSARPRPTNASAPSQPDTPFTRP